MEDGGAQYRAPRTAAEKAKAFTEGQYEYLNPPTCDAGWDDDAWIAFIDAHNAWRIPVEPPTPDVTVDPQGAVVIVRTLTDAAREWVNQHVCYEAWLGWGRQGIAIQLRYVDDVLRGMAQDGLLIAEA